MIYNLISLRNLSLTFCCCDL